MAEANFEFQTTYRFSVSVDNINYADFTECTLPSLQVETMDIKEGGQNTYIHKLPIRVNAGTIKLKNGIMGTAHLLEWYMQVLEGNMEAATRQITITMYDVSRQPVMSWSFYKAYPIKWSGPTLKTSENSIAIEELEFAHHGFVVQ